MNTNRAFALALFCFCWTIFSAIGCDTSTSPTEKVIFTVLEVIAAAGWALSTFWYIMLATESKEETRRVGTWVCIFVGHKFVLHQSFEQIDPDDSLRLITRTHLQPTNYCVRCGIPLKKLTRNSQPPVE